MFAVEFENNYKNFYAKTLELNRKNDNSCKALFFTNDLFDKRDTFLFFINRMSYLDSNMLCEIFYASIGPQVLHIASTETDLVIRLNELILCLYGWKTKVVNVPVSFHYWKIYLGDILR